VSVCQILCSCSDLSLIFSPVGRTGAGKSTLGLALLRAIPTEGRVLFDNRDTGQTNLDALRRAISIIPQSPELLAGTLRENLDPLKEHDDAELNAALQAAGLTQHTDDDWDGPREFGLDTQVESGGTNFSHGQRQIIALARALIRRTKLVIMDEATSAIGERSC
jgi:ABC-type multidrug transport system fused ATPase/permease subunit